MRGLRSKKSYLHPEDFPVSINKYYLNYILVIVHIFKQFLSCHIFYNRKLKKNYFIVEAA
jgi:hypothetical protein